MTTDQCLMTDLCRRHRCPSVRDSGTVRSVRVVRRVVGRGDGRHHRRHRTAPCSRPRTCTAPRSAPQHARPSTPRRVVRPSTASRRRRKWNLNTGNSRQRCTRYTITSNAAHNDLSRQSRANLTVSRIPLVRLGLVVDFVCTCRGRQFVIQHLNMLRCCGFCCKTCCTTNAQTNRTSAVWA